MVHSAFEIWEECMLMYWRVTMHKVRFFITVVPETCQSLKTWYNFCFRPHLCHVKILPTQLTILFVHYRILFNTHKNYEERTTFFLLYTTILGSRAQGIYLLNCITSCNNCCQINKSAATWRAIYFNVIANFYIHMSRPAVRRNWYSSNYFHVFLKIDYSAFCEIDAIDWLQSR